MTCASRTMLLIESDAHRRRGVARALRHIAPVTAVGRVSEIERWPAGDIVITEFRFYTPFWLTVGARQVIVLADSAPEGADACGRGATAWVPRMMAVPPLIRALRRLVMNHQTVGSVFCTNVRTKAPAAPSPPAP